MDSRIQHNEIKISIIMPVYNTEQYVDRCIESVLGQTYKNIEFIVVDDCSSGDIKERIKKYSQKDNRIIFISNEENKGLFQTRLTGACQASGQYIAFIDSDDFVSVDYYHTLLETALAEDADIVVGKTVFQKTDGRRYIYNLHDACFHFKKLEGGEVQKRFFRQKGLCFSWHTVWNKIYKKELWDKCVPYYQAVFGHVVMTEDIAFSSVLFYFAHSVATAENDAYFYCANENASTNTDKVTFARFEKNMSDIKTVFDFVECFLKRAGAEKKLRDDFHEWRKYYARMWRYMPKERLAGKDADRGMRILYEFCPDEDRDYSKDDGFFDSVSTEWRGGLEGIKEKIACADDEYISFDIFDTLIIRPFYHPSDLFYLMEAEFEKLADPTLSFYKIRTVSEEYARKKYGNIHPEWEDVTVDEIYDSMGELFKIEKSIVARLKAKEQALEVQFCQARQSGKELYEVAKLTGKKILLVSDMYLDVGTMKEILSRNSYVGYEKLYLSSDIRKAKYTGNLFWYVKNEIGIKNGQHIYHIGDNWQSDYVYAEKNGFVPIFFPKAKEVFENEIKGINTNDCAIIAEKMLGAAVNKKELYHTLSYSCMTALVYNKYFDNPYRSFHAESDFNIDPGFIGYYVVGMHLEGLVSWIVSHCEDKEIGTVHFLARDGYLLKKAYDMIAGKENGLPRSNYLYASRRALMPGMIWSEKSFYNLPIEYRNHSPKSLLKVLNFASRDIRETEKKKLCEKSGIMYECVFADTQQFYAFIRFFIEKIFSKEVLERNQSLARDYYSCIEKNDITFDMGYSGRIQAAISRLLGQGRNVLFVHSDNHNSWKMQRIAGFKIESYYDHVPYVSGLLREHLLSDSGPACVGFMRNEGRVHPVLEKETKIFQDTFVIDTVQDAALMFIEDYHKTFHEYKALMPMCGTQASLPFEGYLRASRYIDRKIYAASYFEDLVYGAAENINVEEFINRTVPYEWEREKDGSLKWNDRLIGKVGKAVTYFFHDRSLLKEIIQIKIGNWKKGHRGMR